MLKVVNLYPSRGSHRLLMRFNYMNNLKAVLFDLDGVLIDSETLYTRFWQRVGEIHHLPSPTFAYDIKGTTLSDILNTYFPAPDVRADIDRLLHKFENEIIYPIYPGAIPLVDALRARGIKTIIVTSSDRRKMDYLFAQHPDLSSHFDDLVTAEDVTHSKPHPEPYLTGARKARCLPSECVVVEDSFQGLESGRRAGCKVVALATTNPRSSLLGKADFIADHISSLSPQILTQL